MAAPPSFTVSLMLLVPSEVCVHRRKDRIGSDEHGDAAHSGDDGLGLLFQQLFKHKINSFPAAVTAAS